MIKSKKSLMFDFEEQSLPQSFHVRFSRILNSFADLTTLTRTHSLIETHYPDRILEQFSCTFSLFFMNLQEIDVRAGGGKPITIGELCRHFLERLEWFDTRFPRIPVKVQVCKLKN